MSDRTSIGWRIGVDTGGTFTDLVAVSSEGDMLRRKVASTPSDPSAAVFESLERTDFSLERVGYFILGTTIATNAIIQRRGATTILITTAGFEDNLYIQRIDRLGIYDLQWVKVEPYAERKNTIGVRERILSDGTVMTGLTEEETERVVAETRLRLQGAVSPAVAVSLLFSYVNPEHEIRLAERLREAFPNTPISVSSEVAPIWREYERTSTVVMDAYVKPIIGEFGRSVSAGLTQRRVGGRQALMKSNGGQVQVLHAGNRPVEMALSGPAGGMIGGAFWADAVGSDRSVTLDMGGTSADVGIVVDGGLRFASQFEVGWGIPMAIPIIDVATIGAGGSSIASVDFGGFLQVGPESAGADPGPACYGKGGVRPTITDANIVNGRLNPDYFLGGEISLDEEKAWAALRNLGVALQLTEPETAESIIAVAVENMAAAVRLVTVDRGYDYREFDLIAFGGAGPLHAAEIAARMGMRRVIIPPSPGLVSAFGALIADERVDRHATVVRRLDRAEAGDIAGLVRALAARTVGELELQHGAKPADVHVSATVSCRYIGQNFEQDVVMHSGPVGPGMDVALQDASFVEKLAAGFHAMHETAYGYHLSDQPIEAVNIAVTAVIHSPAVRALPYAPDDTPQDDAHRRSVYVGEGKWQEADVFRRGGLHPGFTADGPAIIEEPDSTIYVPPGFRATVDESYCLLLVDASREDAEVTTATRTGPVPERTEGKPSADRVSLSILNKQLKNICDEMGVSMMRTSYSPIFSEGLDFSTLLLDRHGNLLSTTGNPAMLGASLYAATWIIREVGPENFDDGDVWIHNDPYRGGSHMPEHMMVTPIYVDGSIVAYVGNIAHLSEIGGMAPGSFAATATDVFQEGLRVPPVRLFRRGDPVHDVWRIILANHRTPDNSWGDLHAMLGSLHVGERRMKQLFEKQGVARLTAQFSAIQDLAEAYLREQIRLLPDGIYHAEDAFDDDGITDRPYTIRLDLVVDGDEIVFDFSESDEQALGPINSPYVVTLSGCLNGLLYVLGHDSAQHDVGVSNASRLASIPINAGLVRPVRVVAPAGTMTCVKLPGACVGGQTEQQPRVLELVMRAVFGQTAPDRAAASSGATALNFLFGGVDSRTNDYYAHYHLEGVGWGGRATSDGNSAQILPHGNCRNTPVEVFETRWPWIHLRYGLDADSGGPGKQRGGMGIERVLEVADSLITVSALSDRHKNPPRGIYGGGEGSKTRIEIQQAGEEDFRSFQEAFGLVSPTKFTNIRLTRGDRVRLVSPGGGGYGDPFERDPELIQRDVEQGWVSPQNARALYGAELDEAGRVDASAMAKRRVRQA